MKLSAVIVIALSVIKKCSQSESFLYERDLSMKLTRLLNMLYMRSEIPYDMAKDLTSSRFAFYSTESFVPRSPFLESPDN